VSGAGGTQQSARRLIVAVLVLVALVLPVGSWAVSRLGAHPSTRGQATTSGQAGNPTARVPFPPGTPAPPLQLAALSGGGTVDLASFRGHPVLVNFWASWCDPCKREFPLLRQTLAQHNASGLVILGVLVNDSATKGRAFMRAHNATWPVGVDAHRQAITAYKVNVGLPQSFFVRRDGTLASRQLGELGAADLQAQLATILAP
jgi:cytochrome c biogenesis protein CcmG/thiol:disulfide interchange protein DsbE